MTKLEIINETVAYYETHPRAIKCDSDDTHSSCWYRNDKGEMCAIGRIMTGAALDKYAEDGNSISTGFFNKSIDEILKPQYAGHQLLFWKQLQNLHDVETNWLKMDSGNQLSEEGHRRKIDLINAYC